MKRNDFDNEYAVIVDQATVRFNVASERIDNLKEYFVKLVKRELMFKEFLNCRDEWFRKVYLIKINMRDIETI